ncbi:Uncharacterized protein GBIM_03899 [Gryllus bimaculatus]|nr:Uncharacterized protein GBIM_03899 [Gryllus bimaculatus]
MSVQLLDLPAEFRRLLNGLCKIKLNNEDYLAAWYDENILLSPIKVGGDVCKIWKIKESVRWVFHNRISLYCVDKSGIIYTLGCVQNEDDLDVFDSSVDEYKTLGMGQAFIPCSIVKSIVCISPLRWGFILLKYCFGKLYVELYGSVTNDNEIKKSACFELCTAHDISTKHCVLKVFQADSMTPDFRQEFLKILDEYAAEIVFIGLPNGYVYNVVVCSKGSVFLSKPALIYSSTYSVVDIVPICGTEENLTSKIGIVLSCGTVVFVWYDILSHSLCYKVCNLPSYPLVLLDTGDSFVYGDGLDLWHCTLNRSTSSIDFNLLAIKGVCFITKYMGDINILAATVHKTFYSIILKDSTLDPNFKGRSTCSSICEMTESLYRELQQIEMYKKEVNCEENFISGVSMFSRHMLYEKCFSDVVSVQSLSCINVENYLFNYCHSNGFEEMSTGNKSLSNFFLINISVENKSELDFSPFLWSLASSVTSGGVTTQICNKLLRSFKIGSSLSSSLILCIEQPFLGVSVNISLVRQLLDDSKSSATSPWLIIPIIVKELDTTHFLRNFVIERENKDLFKENILYLAQKNNSNLGKPFFENSNVFEPCYVYEFHVPSNVNEFWLMIQQLCSCDHLLREKVLVHENCHSIVNKFSAFAGALEIEFILSGQRIKLSSPSSLLLFAVKEAIIERWKFHSDSSQAIPLLESVVARALLYKEKMQIEKMTHSKMEFEAFKNVWRHFISEFLNV